jgi:hypothetical protein
MAESLLPAKIDNVEEAAFHPPLFESINRMPDSEEGAF